MKEKAFNIKEKELSLMLNEGERVQVRDESEGEERVENSNPLQKYIYYEWYTTTCKTMNNCVIKL